MERRRVQRLKLILFRFVQSLGILQAIDSAYQSVELVGDGPRFFYGDLLSMVNAKKANLNNLPDTGKDNHPIITGFGGFHMDMVPGQGALFKYVI